jgi:hypothetical protein
LELKLLIGHVGRISCKPSGRFDVHVFEILMPEIKIKVYDTISI